MVKDRFFAHRGVSEPLEIKVARTHPDARMPTKGSVHAAGWDLYSLEDTEVPFRASVKLRTGLHVAIPVGYEGQVRSRSSLGSKGLILPHSIGTIDADYRGELFVLMTWIGGGGSYVVKAGERIAQLLITPIPKAAFTEVRLEELGETARGEGGFGSTGRF
jgi:dUTP pyrophosphatase